MLFGGDGNDTMRGGDGMDTLTGGAGHDSMYAGLSDGDKDTFKFGADAVGSAEQCLGFGGLHLRVRCNE